MKQACWNGPKFDNLSAELYLNDMAQMNVSLPDALKSWAESRVDGGLYSSASDYVRDLMRKDKELTERLARLQQAIDEGLSSPPSKRSLDEIVAEGFKRVA
jgi:antitoxin ParD1/3/4